MDPNTQNVSLKDAESTEKIFLYGIVFVEFQRKWSQNLLQSKLQCYTMALRTVKL